MSMEPLLPRSKYLALWDMSGKTPNYFALVEMFEVRACAMCMCCAGLDCLLHCD